MQILDSEPPQFARFLPNVACLGGMRVLLLVLLTTISQGLGGCSKDPALASIETDSHGYLCQKCGAKVYTGQKEFLESKCPKCQQESLVDVIGYWCEKDRHLTLRPKLAGPEGAAVCEKCGTQLKNAMVSPREKDLLAWGATKTRPHQARRQNSLSDRK